MWSKLRLKHGLRWRKNHPPMPWNHVLILLLCVATYLGVSHVDRLDERVKEMEGYKPYAEVLFDCMSGANGFYFADTTEVFACDIHSLGKSNIRGHSKQDS